MKWADIQFTEAEIALIRDAYHGVTINSEINLAALAAKLGRLRSTVCHKARSLGLTNIRRKRVLQRKQKKRKYANMAEWRVAQAQITRERLARNGHPRGMLGKQHTSATKEHLAETTLAMNARRTPDEVRAYVLKGLQKKVRNGTYAPHRHGTTWKSGWREIGGVRKFYRSKWEANYAHYLQWQKAHGFIVDWKHEPTTFWFDGIKRGCVSYLPDFWVKDSDGSEAYHEVKGWMDARSKTKIKRMAIYHPTVNLVVVNGKRYHALAKSVSGIVDGWEP